jgi:hypothetical protein
MKKLAIFFLACCLFTTIYGQFQYSYGTPYNEIGQSVRSTYFDNGYVIGGYSDYGFISDLDATIIKTSEHGEIKWAKVYGGKSKDIFNSVRPVSLKEDRGYVGLGYTNSFGNGESDFFFVRTDPEGYPIIYRTYGGEKYENGHCLQVIRDVETGNEGLIMIGESNSFYGQSNSLKMYVVKTDLYGNVIRSAIVGNLANHYGFWIEQTNDGGFIAVGMSSYTCGNNGSTTHYDIFVAKLKPDLNLEWARTIGGGPDLPYTDYASSVSETEDGYIISGKTKSFGFKNTYDAFLLKLNKEGGFKWLNTYGYLYSDGVNMVLNDESAGLKHQYIMVGSYGYRDSKYALLIGTDRDGNMLWNRGYGIEGIQSGHEIDHNIQDGYSFVGYENSFGLGENNKYHVVTDSYGYSNCPECEIEPKIIVASHEPCIREGGYSFKGGATRQYDPRYVDGIYRTFRCGTILKNSVSDLIDNNIDPVSDNGLKVFPNPVSNWAEISYPSNFQGGKIILINNIGQVAVDNKLPKQNTYSFSLEELKSGFYMLYLVDNKGEFLSKKIIKTDNQ